MTKSRFLRWAATGAHNAEHFQLTWSDEGILAVGIVTGIRESVTYGIRYQIRCDPTWHVREVLIDGAGRPDLHLLADGEGHWFAPDGLPIAEYDGCIDVDISATPFTNTLPIRRLNSAVGERRLIRVVYIQIPAFKVSAVDQAYTCLEPMRLYRYEGLFRRFSAELPVDEDGLVVSYPGRFERVVDAGD